MSGAPPSPLAELVCGVCLADLLTDTGGKELGELDCCNHRWGGGGQGGRWRQPPPSCCRCLRCLPPEPAPPATPPATPPQVLLPLHQQVERDRKQLPLLQAALPAAAPQAAGAAPRAAGRQHCGRAARHLSRLPACGGAQPGVCERVIMCAEGWRGAAARQGLAIGAATVQGCALLLFLCRARQASVAACFKHACLPACSPAPACPAASGV